MKMHTIGAIFLAAGLLTTSSALAQTSDPTEAAFRETFKTLIETNTAHSTGSCTLAAERMAERLKAAGFVDADIHLYAPEDAPKDGLLVARLKGKGKGKGLLLLAHIDVVEARREDWTRDPFSLIEEDGFFYGRGALDDKAMAAIFTDTMVRLKREKYTPSRDIILALTCGEETEGVFNGARWLSENHRDWIDADLALNEGAGGVKNKDGSWQIFTVVAGEKVYQDYVLTATDAGGHSSQPKPGNPIYRMATALGRIETFAFPTNMTDASREFFKRAAPTEPPETAAAMNAIVANPNDATANAFLSRDKKFNAFLRTTCVATMITGGHAPNALPQTVKANVNCRIIPGESPDAVRQTLQTVVNDPMVTVEFQGEKSIATPTPALDPRFMKAVESSASVVYPKVPITPVLSTGASDSIYTNAIGIPTYGVLGIFREADGNGEHGLNERVAVKALMDGRRFHYTLIKTLTQ